VFRDSPSNGGPYVRYRTDTTQGAPHHSFMHERPKRMAQRPVAFVLLPPDAYRGLADADRKAYIEALRHSLDATTAEASSPLLEPRPTAKPRA